MPDSVPVLIGVPYPGVLINLQRNLGPDFNYRISQKKNDISRLVQEEVRQGNNFFVFAGGDSSLDEALNSDVNLKELTFFILPFGTANNAAGNTGMKKNKRTFEFARQIAGKKLDAIPYTIPTDLMRISYDNGKCLIAASSFSLGYSARACDEAERKSETSRLRKFIGKKQLYLSAGLRALNEHFVLDAQIDYELDNGKIETAHFNAHGIAMPSGPYFAGMRNWNINGCPYDGIMEIMVAEDMGLEKKLDFAAKATLTRTSDFGKAAKDAKSDCHGMICISRVKSASMLLRNIKDTPYSLIEAGGVAFPIEKPGMPVKVEVLPGATSFVYMPLEQKNAEGFTNWH